MLECGNCPIQCDADDCLLPASADFPDGILLEGFIVNGVYVPFLQYDDSDNPTPYLARCAEHGDKYLSWGAYLTQSMDRGVSPWTCPLCGASATFDRGRMLTALELLEEIK